MKWCCPVCHAMFESDPESFKEVRTVHGVHLRHRTIIPNHFHLRGPCRLSLARHTVTADIPTVLVCNRIDEARRSESAATEARQP